VVEALAWVHGFGGGCFVGLLIGLWLGYDSSKADATDGVSELARQDKSPSSTDGSTNEKESRSNGKKAD
jgi:hypothetical protein